MHAYELTVGTLAPLLPAAFRSRPIANPMCVRTDEDHHMHACHVVVVSFPFIPTFLVQLHKHPAPAPHEDVDLLEDPVPTEFPVVENEENMLLVVRRTPAAPCGARSPRVSCVAT